MFNSKIYLIFELRNGSNGIYFHMDILKLPQLLLIAGNGRDSGKTTLACLLIKKFSTDNQIISLKISPHKHKIVTTGDVFCDTENLYLAEETNPHTGKDSSRMLQAGASRSFFICATEEQLPVAMNKILELSDSQALFVCESGGLRKYAEPGLFFIVDRAGNKDIKPGTRMLLEFDPIWLTFDGHDFNLNLNEIVIQHNSWKKTAGHDII
jgi:hypothetical protein